jgi:hypothetical protein
LLCWRKRDEDETDDTKQNPATEQVKSAFDCCKMGMSEKSEPPIRRKLGRAG